VKQNKNIVERQFDYMASKAVNRRDAYIKLWEGASDLLAKHRLTNQSWLALRSVMQRLKFKGFRIP